MIFNLFCFDLVFPEWFTKFSNALTTFDNNSANGAINSKAKTR